MSGYCCVAAPVRDRGSLSWLWAEHTPQRARDHVAQRMLNTPHLRSSRRLALAHSFSIL